MVSLGHIFVNSYYSLILEILNPGLMRAIDLKNLGIRKGLGMIGDGNDGRKWSPIRLRRDTILFNQTLVETHVEIYECL